MYSISSLTNSQNKSSSKAIGGLASGLDTAELIRNMTARTRSKIAQQNQAKQILAWQTEAYRGVSDKLVNFSRKYTSFGSSTNLLSQGFYTSSSLTATGENASKVTVTGTSTMAGEISIVSATKASDGGALSTKQLKVGTNTASATTKLSELDPTITNFGLTIDGNPITGLTADSTIQDVINAIDGAGVGIKAEYIESSGIFKFTTTNDRDVQIGGNLATDLFGKEIDVLKKSEATLSIKYGNSTDVTMLSSDSNSFNVDGLNITINEAFSGGNINFNTSTDTDKVFNGIKDMIKDYNDMIDHINKEHSEKRNRNFMPLSDEQRKELSEDEAKKWDEKAKAGMLSGNADISGLRNEMRAVFFSDAATMAALKEIGITPSNEWRDGGKIVLDEEKLKKAIEDNPENIRDLFAKPASDSESGGLMVKMRGVTEKYAKTVGAPRGILIEKAGSTFSPASMTENVILEQSKRIDKIIENLNRTLATEETRYQKQFTNLETVLARMNSQAGWLNQQFGG